MNDPIDRQIRELTEDRSGFVEDLREIEMAVWPDDGDDGESSNRDNEENE